MNNKKFYRYDDFIIEKNIFSKIKGAVVSGLKKVGDLFQGKGAWLYNALLAQKENKLPKGVKIYPSTSDIKKMNELGAHYSKSDIPATRKPSIVKESFSEIINEDDSRATNVKMEHPNPSVLNVSIKKAMKKLEFHFKAKTPLMIWGAPGIGKTDIVKQVAEKFDVPCLDIDLSMMRPEDFGGLPVTGTKTLADGTTIPTTASAIPEFFPFDNGPDDKGGIMFLDEMNRAEQDVLNVCLKLVLNRQIGKYKVPSKWVILAAGNRHIDSDAVRELDSALGNRFPHINIVINEQDWINWAASSKATYKEETDTKDEKGNIVTIDIPYIHPTIIAYISFKKMDALHYLVRDANADEGPNPAWPSPRSWSAAAKEITMLERQAKKDGEHLTEDDWLETFQSHIGAAAASEFMTFVKVAKTIDMKALEFILTDSSKVPLPPKVGNNYKPDVAFAMLAFIVSKIREMNRKMTPEEFGNMTEYLVRLNELEYVAAFMNLWKSSQKAKFGTEYWREPDPNGGNNKYAPHMDKITTHYKVQM